MTLPNSESNRRDAWNFTWAQDYDRHSVLISQHSALNCLKHLIRRFKSAVWIKPNKNTFQIVYETISDW